MAITLDGTAGISSVDGSAASPSVRGADSNTGVYYGTDRIYMSTGGVKRFEISDGGDIQVPDSCKFEWGGGQDLAIYYDGAKSYIKGQGSNCGGIDIDNSADADVNIELKAGQDIYLKTSDGGTNAVRCERGGPVHLYNNGTEVAYTHGAGVFVVGNTGSDGYLLGVKNTGNPASNRDFLRFFNSSGSEAGSIEHTSSTGTAFQTSSDHRLKENVVDITDGIERLKLLKPRKFSWKDDPELGLRDGFIAHEVSPAIPHCVSGEKEAVKEDGSIQIQTIEYSQLTPLLTAALQEAIIKIETLETKVAALEAG